MKTKKKLLVAAATVSAAAMMTFGVFASGWQKNATGWWYGTNDANTTWHANGWQWIDGDNDGTAECYYFDQNGYMLSATTTPDGYTVNSNGQWTYDGIIQRKSVKTTAANTTTETTASSHTYGEYEYDCNGISLAALDMLGRTRAENAKYGEEAVYGGGTLIDVKYKNGLSCKYDLNGGYDGVDKHIYANLGNESKLFKYANEGTDDEDLVKILKKKNFDCGSKNLMCGTDGFNVTAADLKSNYDSKYYGVTVRCPSDDVNHRAVTLYKCSGQD